MRYAFYIAIAAAVLSVPSNASSFWNYIKAAASSFTNTKSISFTLTDSDYLDCGNVPVSNTMSVCVWTKGDPASSGRVPVSKYSASDNHRSWLINTLAGKAQVLLSAGGTTPITKDYQGSQTVFGAGWNEFCFTLDTSADRLRLYGNGTLDASVTKASDSSITGGIHSSSTELYIGGIRRNGAGTSPASLITAKIDNISIWNIELDATGISNTRNGSSQPADLTSHPNYSNLVAWWWLGDDTDAITTNGILDRKGSYHCNPVNLVSGDIVTDVP